MEQGKVHPNDEENSTETVQIYQDQLKQLIEVIGEAEKLLTNRIGSFNTFDLEQIAQILNEAKTQSERISNKIKILETEIKIAENIEGYNKEVLRINQSNMYSFRIPYFEEGLTGIFANTEPVWSKMEGYETDSFLPVYRISLEDHIDTEELFSEILTRQSDIITTAKASLLQIDANDSLRKLFEEAIICVEEDKYFAGQALLATIYGLIRDNRLKVKNFLSWNENHFLTRWGQLRDFVLRISTEYTEEDVKLALMTLHVFAHTKYLSEDHDPQRVPSRNAITHKNPVYFSKYNCLCFLLYVSEVFDLLYKLESLPNSIVKSKIEWGD